MQQNIRLITEKKIEINNTNNNNYNNNKNTSGSVKKKFPKKISLSLSK